VSCAVVVQCNHKVWIHLPRPLGLQRIVRQPTFVESSQPTASLLEPGVSRREERREEAAERRGVRVVLTHAAMIVMKTSKTAVSLSGRLCKLSRTIQR
jgi:hypothetical protein